MVTDNFYPLYGGSQTVALELGAVLASRGHKVTALARNPNQTLPANEMIRGVFVDRYPVLSRFVPKSFFETLYRATTSQLRYLRQAEVDVIITHHVLPGFGTALLQRWKSVRHIHYFHGPAQKEYLAEMRKRPTESSAASLGTSSKRAWDYLSAFLLRVFQRDIIRSAGSIVCLSDYMREEVRELSPDNAPKVTIIPGGTDSRRFAPVDALAKERIRARYSIPQGKRVILTVRRLVARTGVDLLLHAFQKTVTQFPDVMLVICGNGPSAPYLEGLSAQLNLSEHVRFTGIVSDEALLQYHQLADLFVMPSIELEGFGLSLIDSLACGVPAIGTPIGGIPQLLVDLDPGLVAKSASTESLSECMCSYLGEPDRMRSLSEKARKIAETKYDWQIVADRFEQTVLADA